MNGKYDLSSKHDMFRFEGDLTEGIKRAARDSIQANGIEADCPLCGKPFQMLSGKNICPHCGKTVTVDFDWSEF